MKAIEVKYHGPTTTKGSSMSATDGDTTIRVSYDHGLDSAGNAAAAAKALGQKKGWTGTMIGGALKGSYVFVFATGTKIRL